MDNTESSPSVRWEYTALGAFLNVSEDIERINKLGQQGWELIIFRNNAYIFKRRLP